MNTPPTSKPGYYHEIPHVNDAVLVCIYTLCAGLSGVALGAGRTLRTDDTAADRTGRHIPNQDCEVLDLLRGDESSSDRR